MSAGLQGNTGALYIYAWPGDPTNVRVLSLDAPENSIFVDTTAPILRQKISPRGDNSLFVVLSTQANWNILRDSNTGTLYQLIVTSGEIQLATLTATLPASASIATTILRDTVSGTKYQLTAASGMITLVPYTGPVSPQVETTATDTVSGKVYTITVHSGQLRATANA